MKDGWVRSCWRVRPVACHQAVTRTNTPTMDATKVTTRTAAHTKRARPRGSSTGSHAQAERHERRPASADSGTRRLRATIAGNRTTAEVDGDPNSTAVIAMTTHIRTT